MITEANAEAGVLSRLSALEATTFLTDDQGIPENWAAHVVQIARQFGEKAEPVASGYVTVTWSKAAGYTIQMPGSRKVFSAMLAKAPATRYSQSRTSGKPKLKETTMPGKTAAPAVEETEEAKDYTVYATKPATATMVDFADWLIDEVGLEFKTEAAELAFRKGVALGGTLRMEFQRSDLNKERRAQRAKERAESNGAEDEAEPEAKPTPAKRGRPAKGATDPAADETPKPATRRGRGRPAAAAAEAPF